jgi:hypothetical protein
MRKIHFILVTALVISLSASAQKRSVTAKLVSTDLVIDGKLDEAVWQSQEPSGGFTQYFPTDTLPATNDSNIRILYDKDAIYIGLTMKTSSDEFVVNSLKRDYRGSGIDNIAVMFDTFNDGNNAFIFGMTPLGVQREGLITNGGATTSDYQFSWDAKWQGEAFIYDGYYSLEMSIPFNSLKFENNATKWGFRVHRFDMQTNETSVWVPIPQNQILGSLAFTGELEFEQPLSDSKTSVALIPFLTAGSSKDFENATPKSSFSSIGGDVKIPVGKGMNLDLTFNPDFSQVEVDNFITNLTRFEVSLPERRQFFIDNNDLFGAFGGGRDANPFFSRRIGIAKDNEGNTIENGITAGMRLTGKLNDKLRVGVLSIQTESDLDNGIPSNNNSMIALQQKVFSRSNISAFIINRESSESENTDYEKYNRVIGVDYNLASADNTYVGKFYTHKSLSPGDTDGNLSVGTNLQYNTRTWSGFLDAIYIDEEFVSDLGFIPRKGILKWGGKIGYRIWPKKGIFNSHSFDTFQTYTHLSSLDYTQTDYLRNFGYEGRLNNQGQIELSINNRYTFLTDEFSPTRQDDATPLPANSEYDYTSIRFQFQSDRRKLFSYNIQTDIGEFFNGTKSSFETRLSFRVQPKLNVGLNSNIDRIDLPEDFGNATIVLISPRIDYTFNRSLFWSTLIQYSNQRDNLGINSRLQWRFAPLSDLFLVYNDNYFVNQWGPRSRSINLKLTYWLNI